MKIVSHLITIIAEIVILLISIAWFIRTKEEEPLIGIIGSSVFLVVSLLNRFTRIEKARPKIALHKKSNFNMRGPLGYTKNNPDVILSGIDIPEQVWDIVWSYNIEIRNNSSITAYNFEINYINRPSMTTLNGEIGKIQPIKSDEMFEFTFKLQRTMVGTHIDADKYLKENADTILKDMVIIAKYRDEYENKYSTEYNWIKDSNEYKNGY